MAGKQFKIDVEISSTAFPILSVDPILPARGALMLVDFTHPSDPYVGIPKERSMLKNIASEQALKVYGSTVSDVTPEFRIMGSVAPEVKRTSKGGLYTKGNYAGAWHPVALIQHLMSNPNNDIYVSLWTRNPSTINGYSQLERNGTGVSANLTGSAYRLTGSGMKTTSVNAPTTHTVLGSDGHTTPNADGVYNIAGAVSGNNLANGTALEFQQSFGAVLFGTFGNNGPAERTSYRFYMEDLTISNRTYAQVREIDSEIFAQEVTNNGGRYKGDVVV